MYLHCISGFWRKAAQHVPRTALKDVEPHVHIHLLWLRVIAHSVVDLVRGRVRVRVRA